MFNIFKNLFEENTQNIENLYLEKKRVWNKMFDDHLQKVRGGTVTEEDGRKFDDTMATLNLELAELKINLEEKKIDIEVLDKKAKGIYPPNTKS